MKKQSLILTLLAAILSLSSCLKEPDTSGSVITPEISKKWITAVSGSYAGWITAMNPKTGTNETFTSSAKITANDSIITIDEFPISSLAKYTKGDDAKMLSECKDIAKTMFKAELHPYNGGLPQVYTFFMFPPSLNMTVSTMWQEQRYDIKITWAAEIVLDQTVAQRYGEAEMFPIATYDIPSGSIYGHILIDSFEINGRLYEEKVLYDVNLLRAINE